MKRGQMVAALVGVAAASCQGILGIEEPVLQQDGGASCGSGTGCAGAGQTQDSGATGDASSGGAGDAAGGAAGGGAGQPPDGGDAGPDAAVEAGTPDQVCADGGCESACQSGAKQCDGSNGVQTCDGSGQWSAGAACTGQACVGGACVGVCEPGATRCDGASALETCSSSGQWGSGVACSSASPYCFDGACTADSPSCHGLAADCGPNASESCCTSLLVTGGSFSRSYDNVTYTDPNYPATVSDFYLDKYEVTVGRFRRFKVAWEQGWRPVLGAGAHTHLNGGSGLAATAGGNEAGWDGAWESSVLVADADLQCSASYQTWTAAAGAGETRAINCVNWYTSYAFCIWDGGFLPSEAEWNYAAAGGTEQRAHPWSSPSTDVTIDCTYANYNPGPICESAGVVAVGSRAKGNGRYGHSDLGGNVWEWQLDWYAAAYPTTSCNDCANLASAADRGTRGGSVGSVADYLLASFRAYNAPTYRSYGQGVRCARTR